MWGNDLPEFIRMNKAQVNSLLTTIFRHGEMLKLIEFDDHHFRAIFKSTHFTLQEGAKQPTKSQWSTLKKQLKRRDRRVFVFKEYGELNCAEVLGEGVEPQFDCLYLDFGFLRD